MAKILFIEDEEFLMEGLIFEMRDNGHEVIVTPNGEKAITYLKNDQQDFDLIILDVMLPTGEPEGPLAAISKEIRTDELGLEILRQLREEMNDQTPVIVLTAAIDVDLKNRIIELGIARYFSKPTSLNDFMAAVNKVLPPKASTHEIKSTEIT
ncbi:MAG: response regulator transcription factor [Anaerolineae bacterium]|nr:response regulator transcription factor [Anaerolineae bacterium]